MKAQEVIDANRIKQPKNRPESLNPPGESLTLMGAPIILRMPPALAFSVEIVRRISRDKPWTPGAIELKQLAPRPHVSRIVRHEDGDVADQSHAAIIAICMQ